MSYPVFLCPASGLLFNSLQVQGDLLDNTATFAINYVIRCPVSGHVLHFFCILLPICHSPLHSPNVYISEKFIVGGG